MPSPAIELLFVATDRISAFDHVLGSGIPDKGKILTQLSLFWFDFLKDTVPNHLITADTSQFPVATAALSRPAGRPQHARQARPDVPRRVRRPRLYLRLRLEGLSANRRHLRHQTARRPPRIRSPARAHLHSRRQDQHRRPRRKHLLQTVEQTIGAAHADALRDLTLDIYDKASRHAASKGLILADTKFEFGLLDDTIILADEVLTPDSSRYWPAATYNPGGPQPSFDKQYVRDYLESIHWNKQAPAPALPDEVVSHTREKYLEAFRLITGRTRSQLTAETAHESLRLVSHRHPRSGPPSWPSCAASSSNSSLSAASSPESSSPAGTTTMLPRFWRALSRHARDRPDRRFPAHSSLESWCSAPSSEGL